MKKLDFIFIVLIAAVSALVWRGVVDQTIAGEGYYYFSPKMSLFPPGGKIPNFFLQFDNFPKLATFVMEKFFGGNITPYMWVLFITIIIVNISIYLFVKSITRSSAIALLSALYAGVQYKSSFQLYARGHYQWFLQRVPEVLPVFFSFFFLNKFVNDKKTKFYLLSFIFFALGLFMTHYSTFFVFFYPGFLLASALSKRKELKERLNLVVLSLPFIIFNYLIVKNSSLGTEVVRGGESFWQFLQTGFDIVHKVLYQLVAVTTPFALLRFLSDEYRLNFQLLIPKLFVPVIVFYLFTFLYFWRKKIKYFNFLLGILITLLGHLFLVVFIGRLNVYNEVEEGRYYYLPGIYVGVIISTLLFSLFLHNKKGVLKLFGLITVLALITIRVGTNYKYISRRIAGKQHYYAANRQMLTFLSENKYKFADAYVFIPSPPGPNSIDFLQKFYGAKGTKYLFLDVNWKEKIPSGTDTSKLFVFTYSDEKTISIIDKSEEYRETFHNPPKM